MRRLDIGIASFRSPDKLRQTIRMVQKFSTTEWRLFIVHNDDRSQESLDAINVANDARANDERIVIIGQSNSGYAGAVNSNPANDDYGSGSDGPVLAVGDCCEAMINFPARPGISATTGLHGGRRAAPGPPTAKKTFSRGTAPGSRPR